MTELRIPYDLIANIVLADLKESYKINQEEIETLELISNLAAHRREDLKNCKKLAKALKKVIKYYSTVDEYEDWLINNM